MIPCGLETQSKLLGKALLDLLPATALDLLARTLPEHVVSCQMIIYVSTHTTDIHIMAQVAPPSS